MYTQVLEKIAEEAFNDELEKQAAINPKALAKGVKGVFANLVKRNVAVGDIPTFMRKGIKASLKTPVRNLPAFQRSAPSFGKNVVRRAATKPVAAVANRAATITDPVVAKRAASAAAGKPFFVGGGSRVYGDGPPAFLKNFNQGF